MDIKSKTKNVFQVVKTLDEQKSKFTSISSLFAEDLISTRLNLIASIESILLEDFESLGKKTREVLWRKVYYDPICISKRLFKQQPDCDARQLVIFIKDAIKHYKTLILRFEDFFSLDIRYIIDFAIIANGAEAFVKKSEKEIYTVNEMNHALETIHSFLVSLGDLHRYCIEFNFTENGISSSKSKELAGRYYIEAFKLNPKIGMPHNQLGTLKSGENFELDSIFHYLYSLCSPVPFELSDANVNKVFQQNVEALQKMQQVDDCFNIKDFIQQMILVIDIFFYDKEIAEFNTICRALLVSFKEYLRCSRRSSQNDVTFQVTGIFMLCLLKLKLKNSPKVHSLNAFIVAFCSEIVNVAIDKAEDYIVDREDENLSFCEEYIKKFNDFDRKIKMARGGSSRSIDRRPKDSESEQNGTGSISNSQKNGHTFSSEEASGKSDAAPRITIAKKPQNNHQQPAVHNRRRRRRVKGSESMGSSDESESEAEVEDVDDASSMMSMNSDFDSCDDDDLSDRYSSSDEEDDIEPRSFASGNSDNDDVVIENEEIVYTNGNNEGKYGFKENGHESSVDDVVIEDEEIIFPEENASDDKPMRLKYKKKYTKVNPNIIIGFAGENVSWMKSLKVLFDWLRLSNDILISCYKSNPEFISQIMKLINIMNVDIFTRKIYFDRSMLLTKNVREGLRHLFDTRHQIATQEDIIFKKSILFEELQRPLEWELNYKLQITHEEDVIMRNFKIIDFGFYVCKMKKFHYSFCARTRMFIEKAGSRRGRRQRERKITDGGRKKSSRRRDRRRNRERRRKTSDCDNGEHKSNQNHQEVDEYPSIEQAHKRNFRKGYLKNKTNGNAEKSEGDTKSIEKKNELMGKLWLKSEIQSLESKKTSVALTPYIMVDSKCLTNHLFNVKSLVKSKKFVVLIPKAVLSDLDELKKSSEGAREAIKWLETEFRKGNRFMRIQRDPENLVLPFLKIPSKQDHDASVFMKIVQFANFMVSNNCSEDGSVLTFLTGDNLDDRKATSNSSINQVGVLQSIPVKYEQIVRFYSKCKK